MNKRVGLIIAILSVSSGFQSYGATQVAWNTADNSLLVSNAITSIVSPLTSNSLFLAYASVDQSVSGFNALNPTVPTGDSFLGGRNITGTLQKNGRITSGTQTTSADNSLVGQFVYMVVYDLPFSSYTGPGWIPGVGTTWAIGPISTSGLTDVSAGGTAYTESTVVNATTPLILTVVPEPSTALLAMAGLGALVFRRMRRRNEV